MQHVRPRKTLLQMKVRENRAAHSLHVVSTHLNGSILAAIRVQLTLSERVPASCHALHHHTAEDIHRLHAPMRAFTMPLQAARHLAPAQMMRHALCGPGYELPTAMFRTPRFVYKRSMHEAPRLRAAWLIRSDPAYHFNVLPGHHPWQAVLHPNLDKGACEVMREQLEREIDGLVNLNGNGSE